MASGITCVQEWLEPFWHSNIVTSFGRIARAVLALPVKCGLELFGNEQMHYLECQNGSPFWHSNIATGSSAMARAILALKYCIYGRARMAQAIMAHKYCWQCHSSTQVMPLAVLGWLASHSGTHGNATVRSRIARATLHGT